MDDRLTCLERAFALAAAGPCATLQSIRMQLKGEGYADTGQLSGGQVRQQLIKLMTARRGAVVQSKPTS
jgi:hypothetical protein